MKVCRRLVADDSRSFDDAAHAQSESNANFIGVET